MIPRKPDICKTLFHGPQTGSLTHNPVLWPVSNRRCFTFVAKQDQRVALYNHCDTSAYKPFMIKILSRNYHLDPLDINTQSKPVNLYFSLSRTSL